MQDGMGRLVNIIIRTLLSILGAIAGYQLAQYLSGTSWWPKDALIWDLAMWGVIIAIPALAGYLIAPLFIKGLHASVRYLKNHYKVFHGKICSSLF